MKQNKYFCVQLLLTVLAFMTLFSSCPLFQDLWEKDPETPLEYLTKNCKGEFSNPRKVLPPENKDRSFVLPRGNEEYTKFYSSELKRDIVVSDSLSVDSGKKWHTFYTNYLYYKYLDKIDCLSLTVAKDFSDIKLLYDMDWMLSMIYEDESFSLSSLKEDFRFDVSRHPVYILINATAQEASELDYRLKSLTFRLSLEKYVDRACFFLITTPQSRQEHSIDFDSLNVDDLYQNNFISNFAVVYKKSERSCSYKKLLDLAETE